MLFNAVVTPPPAPVGQTQICLSVKYLLTRGDGSTKLLDNLYDTKAPWLPPGGGNYFGTMGGTGTMPEIIIPLDLLTALRLGLIQETELALPEGVRALFNIIK